MSPIVPPPKHGSPKLLIPGIAVFVLMVLWVRYAESPPRQPMNAAPVPATALNAVTGTAEVAESETGARAAYPPGTRLRVTNPLNHKTAIVTVEAGFEPREGIVVRLPRRAAEELGLPASGSARVTLEPLGP